jgi:ribosome biogenesis protein MAK21
MKALENLLGLARKRSRGQAVDVLRALKDLFAQGSLLPSDRRLKHFQNQAGLVAAFQDSGQNWMPGDRLPRNLENQHLILWAFEHWLKDLFFEILKILEIWCNDEIEFARSRAVSYVWELLKEKPEQESNLLRLLVNKLGDPTKKIASRASYLLLQLEAAHPMMKETVISAIESEFLFKPGQSQHARYYGIITLNQTALSGKEGQVANKLLDIYFSLFVAILKPERKGKITTTKGQNEKAANKTAKNTKNNKEQKLMTENDIAMREKIISALLTGVNRTYPYSSSNSENLSKHLEALFKITHSSNFNTSIQALMLIQQLSSTHQISTDRFYRTLYESLLDPRLATSSKQSLYMNLLYRSLKQDLNIKRVKAFIKRIVQVLNLHQPSFIYGAFHLIKELEQTYPSIKGLVDEAEDMGSDDEEVFNDVREGNEESEGEQRRSEPRPTQRVSRYDARKRDPEHSNADRSCLWEISPYLAHFHPSIAVSAMHLLRHEPMEGKPDLTLHTLIHFLDRFVYRNPKSAGSALRGTSIMQPLAGSERGDLLVSARPNSKLETPVNDESFWKKQAGDIAAEDVFFHEYFSRIGKDKKTRKAKADTRKGQDSETDDEEESEIWKALVRSKGDVEPDEDSDVDLDVEDMKSDDDDIEDGAIGGELGEENDMDEDMPDDDEVDLEGSDDPWADSEDELQSDLDMEAEMMDGEAEVAESSKEARKKKRRKLKQLPTFASAEDYAAMIDNDDGEDQG